MYGEFKIEETEVCGIVEQGIRVKKLQNRNTSSILLYVPLRGFRNSATCIFGSSVYCTLPWDRGPGGQWSIAMDLNWRHSGIILIDSLLPIPQYGGGARVEQELLEGYGIRAVVMAQRIQRLRAGRAAVGYVPSPSPAHCSILP